MKWQNDGDFLEDAGASMTPKISLDVVDAYLKCRLKAHLRLAGQQYVKSDYEAMQIGIRHQMRRRAVEKIAVGTTSTRLLLEHG